MFVKSEIAYKGNPVRSVTGNETRYICRIDVCKILDIDHQHRFLNSLKSNQKIKLNKQQLIDIGYHGQGNGLVFATVDTLIEFLSLDEYKNNDAVQDFLVFLANVDNQQPVIGIPYLDLVQRVSLLYDKLNAMESSMGRMRSEIVAQNEKIKELEKQINTQTVPFDSLELPKGATNKRHALTLLIQEYNHLKNPEYKTSAWYDLTMNIKTYYGEEFDFYKKKMDYEQKGIQKKYPSIFEEYGFLDRVIQMLNWMIGMLRLGKSPLLFEE